MLLLLVVGTALAAGAVAGRHTLRLPAAVVASSAVTAWLLLNGPLEGPVLLLLSADHGLSLGDLLALPAAALVLVLVVQDWRGR